jgi:hypothetical protein
MLTEQIAVISLVADSLEALGVLKVQGDRLDRDYMRRMAASLGIADLLARAFEEAG